MTRTLPAAALALSLTSPTLALADDISRIAVISAFEPEWVLLQDRLEGREDQMINGNRFVTGTLEGVDVVLFLSGVSMVNAAMTTQLALERFSVDGILVSGIAGGVDPDLGIGDVVIAERWGQYLDMIYARETEDGFAIPPWMSSDFDNFGMMFVRNVAVAYDGSDGFEERFWFDTDPMFLETARGVAEDIGLQDCDDDSNCLTDPPQVVIAEHGVSGSAFVDNAAFREWVFDTFDASVLDMETAAIAHVALANDAPFIAFRSLSDLAGGGDEDNEMQTFMSLAANNSAELVTAFLSALDD